jgi:hypothetical protein
MTASLMTLHVAAHTKGLPAAHMGASEWLLTRVAVRMDAKTGGPRERLVAGPAHVPVVVLRIRSRASRREVVVVLPCRSPR